MPKGICDSRPTLSNIGSICSSRKNKNKNNLIKKTMTMG
jgi:hypothetical protein